MAFLTNPHVKQINKPSKDKASLNVQGTLSTRQLLAQKSKELEIQKKKAISNIEDIDDKENDEQCTNNSPKALLRISKSYKLVQNSDKKKNLWMLCQLHC